MNALVDLEVLLGGEIFVANLAIEILDTGVHFEVSFQDIFAADGLPADAAFVRTRFRVDFHVTPQVSRGQVTLSAYIANVRPFLPIIRIVSEFMFFQRGETTEFGATTVANQLKVIVVRVSMSFKGGKSHETDLAFFTKSRILSQVLLAMHVKVGFVYKHFGANVALKGRLIVAFLVSGDFVSVPKEFAAYLAGKGPFLSVYQQVFLQQFLRGTDPFALETFEAFFGYPFFVFS